MPHVKIYHASDRGHFSQIYTGFRRLHRQKVISLSQTPAEACALSARLRPTNPPMLVSIEGRLVVYDLQDGRALCENALDAVDRYFKRGYDPRLVDRLPEAQRHKVRPLGLNYRVWDDGLDSFALQRALRRRGRQQLTGVIRSLGIDLGFVPRLSVLKQPPAFAASPKVLFLTRLWDTDRVTVSPGIRSHAEINEMRIACVAALKAELGGAFIGGVAPDPVAKARCPPALIADQRVVAKRNYLDLMKATPIGITSIGLFDSNGGKLGEYVACSKAIACEPLVHEVPGDFAAGENYLEFTSPEECVQAAVALMEDPHLRGRMMLRNFHYYQCYLKPERLVLNTVAEALGISAVARHDPCS
ncbi:MAG: hypothetical protein ACNA7W_08385 [Pseudomonadales bacterium]